MKNGASFTWLGGSVLAWAALSGACSSNDPANPGPSTNGGSGGAAGSLARGGSSGGSLPQGNGGSPSSGGSTPISTGGAGAGGAGKSGTGGSAGVANAGASGSGAVTGGVSATGGSGTTGGSTSSGGSGGTGTATGGSGGQAGAAGSAGNVGSGGAKGNAFCPAASTLTGSPIPSGAAPARIAGAPPTDSFNMNNFTNVEAPVWIGDSLYFGEYKTTDIPPARIFRIDSSGAISLFVDDSGSNGLALDPSGNLATANHGVGGIVSFNLSTKAKTTLIGTYMNKRFNSPNDLAFRSDGTLYFTDPAYQNNARPQGATLVYQVLPGATTATPITDYESNPNGVTLSLDERSLFVSGGSGLKKYNIDSAGVVEKAGTAFGGLNMNTDGMAVDCAGNLYVPIAGSTNIVVLDTTGKPVANSPITISSNGPSGVTNVAFGGPDRKTLYITGQGSSGQQGVFKVTLNFPGLPY